MRRSIMGALPRDSEIPLLIVIMVVAFNLQTSETAIQTFSSSPNTGCACAGDTLTYGCTAVGPGNTLWEGNVFDCVAKSIVLRHSLYGTGGASGVCNGGNITARSIEVNNNYCYISQLSVRVSSNFNNKTIKCTHDSTMGMKTIGSSTLTILEAPYSSPDSVRLTGVKEGLLTFSWDSLGPNCESANYRVISDCGGCPNSTNLTEINCTDLQLSTEARECSVRVYVVLCGDVGNLSSPVAVMLKLPDAPSTQFVPRFSGDTGQLTALLAAISQTDTYAIGDGIPGSVVSYIMKIMSNSEVLLNSSLAPMMCDEITCEEFVSVPFQCVSLTDISATLSAANKLGVGPASNPARIDCTNKFVEVKYDESASTITCTFLDLPESTVSVRSCQIRYGGCLSDLAELSRDSTTTTNEVVLNVRLTEPGQEYCYLVTASNGLDMIMVEGRISTSTAGGLPVVTITIVAIILFIMVVAIIITTTFVLYFKLWKKSDYHSMGVPEEYLGHVPLNTLNTAAHSEDNKSAEKQRIDNRFNLKRINLDDIVFFKLKTSYPIELKTLVEGALKPRKFERGCAFYEFLYKEDISDVQEIVFVNEDGEYFFPDIGKDKLHVEKLIGEDLLPPKFEGYRVFVQSTGSGRRYIPKESMALYKHFVRIKKHPLIHVDASKLALRRVPNDCTLKKFCENCKPRANINAVYIELDVIEDVGNILDVMLLHKATDRVFTGTSALNMVKEHYDKHQLKKIDDRHWRMYVFKEFGEMYQMRKDMYILYEIQFEVQREEWPLLDIKLPLICADGTPFIQERIEKACTLEAFRDKYDLDTDVHNVLVESSRFSESDLESAQIFDIIIEDLMNENTFYTCRAIWSIIKVYIKEKHRWRVYILREMGPTFMLPIDIWVLYRAKASQFSDTSLMPIVSERFHIVTPSKSCTLDEFRNKQPQKCNIFLEFGYLQNDKNMIDVVLMEEATEKLYSGLYARDLLKKHFSGAKVLDDVKWKVFVFCKFKSSLRLTSTTQVLCQDCGLLAQEFRVLKVDEENVRMSEFVKQEVGDYKKGEAFYEFTQEEDLAFYREILHVPNDLLEHEDENQIVSGEAMISQTPQTQQEAVDKKLLKLKSDTTFFYDISGKRGRRLGIKPPNIPGKRVFIQCTSQGSRCLNKGMLILYKVECGNQSE